MVDGKPVCEKCGEHYGDEPVFMEHTRWGKTVHCKKCAAIVRTWSRGKKRFRMEKRAWELGYKEPF
jgi:hypothetical protein